MRSAEPIGMPKYAATVAVKSLIATEGEEERKNVTKEKNSNHCFTARLGADARRNNCPNRKFISDRCVLIFSKKKHRVDNASISDICR